MSPADELRGAATKLRAQIDNLGGPDGTGPWDFRPDEDNPYPGQYKVTAKDEHGVGDVATGMWLSTAVYVGTMQPTLGTALAAWLEQAAHFYECGVQAAADVFRDDPAGRDAFLTTGPGAPSLHALAVARAINGGEPR